MVMLVAVIARLSAVLDGTAFLPPFQGTMAEIAIVASDSCLALNAEQLRDLTRIAEFVMSAQGAGLRARHHLPTVLPSEVMPASPSPQQCAQAAEGYRALRGSFFADSAYRIAVVRLGGSGYLGQILRRTDRDAQQYVYLDANMVAQSTFFLTR
jgi:hypothetical protein